MTRRATGRAQSLAYWLIARNEHGRIEALTLDCNKTLPVFSNEDEAEMFLRLEGVADGWQVSESRAGELVSMLYGPCTSVKEVALDPVPEMVADRTVGLVSLDRKRFIRRLLASGRFCEPDRGPSPREIEQRREAYPIRYPQGVLHNQDTSSVTVFRGGVSVVRLHTRDDRWGRHFGDRGALGEKLLLEVLEEDEYERSYRRPDGAHDTGP